MNKEKSEKSKLALVPYIILKMWERGEVYNERERIIRKSRKAGRIRQQ